MNKNPEKIMSAEPRKDGQCRNNQWLWVQRKFGPKHCHQIYTALMMKLGKGDGIIHFDILKIILTSSKYFDLKNAILTKKRVLPFQTSYLGYVRENLCHFSVKIRLAVFY